MTKQRDRFQKSKQGQLRVAVAPNPIRKLFCTKRRNIGLNRERCAKIECEDANTEIPHDFHESKEDEEPCPGGKVVPLDVLLKSIEERYRDRVYSLF